VPIVPIVSQGQHNPGRGKGHCLHHAFEEGKEKEIASMLKTPEQIQELQKKLYQKAKQEKSYRFYALYDKAYRKDIIEFAYELVKSRKGAPGIDGITFEAIKGMEGGETRYCKEIAGELAAKTYKPMPVKRVYIPKPDGSKRPLGIPTIKDRVVQMAVKIVIEPIFEADFQNSSYGFRPGRSAHQAMDEVNLQLRCKNTQIIDADITKYFDTIPHDTLLKTVARRIVDKNILRLIKMWLKAPIVEEEGGKRTYKGNDKGTPQGGVISPLLANVYLNTLDVAMTGSRLVRYADDLVVLCRYNVHKTFGKVTEALKSLGLTLNTEKTRVLDATQEGFTFLGFTMQIKTSPRSGKRFPLIVPSKKAIRRIKKEIKDLTCRTNLALPKEVVIVKLNETIRGWANYFYYGNCSKSFAHVKNYAEERVRMYMRRKHRLRGRGYSRYPNEYLYNILGLYKIPTTAPWKLTANVAGRR
jgi:group II intron reverse transcriptase/maturase